MRDLVKIVRYSSSLWRFYLAVAILVVITSTLNLATPFLTKGIVDGLVASLQGQSVAASTFGLFVALILVSDLAITLISNWNGYLGDRLSVKLNSLLSQRYYDHILSLPLQYFDNEITGKITSRLERSISTISDLVNMLSNNFIQFFLTTAITLGVIAFYSWPVALLLAVLFPAYIWLTHLSSKAWQKKQEGINKDIDYAQGRFVEAIGQIRVVKAFVQEAVESKIFANRRRSVERQARAQSKEWHIYDVIRQLVLNVVVFLIFAFIVWQTFRKQLTLGEMTLLLALVNQARWPLFGSSFIIEQVQKAAAGSKDYFKVMETVPAIKDKPTATKLKVKNGRIEYKEVDFAYSGGQKVLTDVSFIVEPGTKLALVGESGEGKTTVANLLLRLYENDGGQVLIDGQDITNVTQASLRAAIGVVFQDPALFSGTVAENITYGQSKFTAEDMEAAAKAANAHDFILKLPKGYDTEIGERGVKLSGGQKQRIAIARAIMKNPPILILDEATSSLDSKAEREVQEALERLMQNRTTMIIAHRLSTIQNVDNIVGLRGGKVAEQGSPDQLAKGSGIYAELLALQTPTKANKAKLRKYDIAKV